MQTAQRVVVTGGSSGIGRAALRFGRAGASVPVVGRNEAALADVVAEVVADVTAGEAPARIVAAALEH